MLTREYGPQGWYTTDAAFRQYADPYASSADWLALMRTPRYRDVLSATDLDSAIDAIGLSGYATDPDYAAKVRSLAATTPEQQRYLSERKAELARSGAPPVQAELGARISALETGWGRSAPGNNLYGIKASGTPDKPLQVAQAGRADISPGLFGSTQPMTPQEVPMYEEELPQPTGMEALMQSPMFLMGASLLAGAGGQSGAVGQGLMRGLAGYQAQQSNNSLQEYRRAQIAEQRRKEALQRQMQVQMERVIATLPPEVQAIARANPEIVQKLAERSLGLNVPWYITPEGIDPRALEYQKAGATTINNFPNVKEGYTYSTTPEGGIVAAPVPGGPADPKTPKSPTEGQRKAGGWVASMEKTEPELRKLEEKLGKRGPSHMDYYTAPNAATNVLASPDYQKYLANSRDWLNAVVRFESGAAVPETEFWRYYQTYFAVPGDPPDVIEVKRQLRRQKMDMMKEAAGAAASDEAMPPLPPGNWEPVR